ncbi:Hpt domain-containing protein [Sediminicoccus sp. KRV36]|uniref:Hpt domain-containing protein n=1 Tax=Sediminicoccus sp. KRV36 TaxID=3133721 RepID=UPI00200CDA36|nr:Hpt domain-containing protein [Sediminicoccus rosea]UPY36960.1 Hpt domain-containing protein [Sediminicoccus rosea]
MAMPGRALFQSLLHRSSIAFMVLVTTLLVASWVLIEDGTHGLRQAALTTATQASARAALAVKDELQLVEGRLLAAQREARALPGVAIAALPPDVTATLSGAEPGQLRFWPLPRTTTGPREVLAFLVPPQPGAPTPMLRIPVALLEALLAPPAGAALRLVTGLGTELAASGTPGDVHASLWVREGALRVDGSASPEAMSWAVWLIPLFGLGTLGFIFRKHLERTDRVELKLTALRGSLARHAAQLSVNEARMRLSQTERVAAERREAALIEAWPNPVALVDPEGKLFAWNEAFAALLPPETLRRDLPLGMLTRHLDVRSAKNDNGRRGPGNRPRIRAITMADGSRLFEAQADLPAPGLAEARNLCREEMLALAPQLRSGVRAGDGGATRLMAHALRGLAANFGLSALVPALEQVERAAQAEDSPGMEAALAGFEREFAIALRQLGSEAA